jgi:hypothetical protein
MGKRKSGKRWLVVVLGVVMVCVFCSAAYGQLWDGNGVEGDPYQIWTPEDMQAIGADANYWDAHFKLMVDIDLGAYTGTSFNIIGYWVSSSDNIPFTGVFDGSGHTISNFTYSTSGGESIGLFGYVYDPNAEIKKVGLVNPDVDIGTEYRVGGLAGWVRRGEISGCYVEGGNVSGNTDVGGLAGLCSNDSDISKCYSTASVSGNGVIGGLVGSLRDSSLCNSYAAGTVTGSKYVGGLVGDNFGGTINNCYATGSISGVELVGGLVGGCHRGYLITGGTISNCYSTGSVSGNDEVGGLVGGNGRPWEDGVTIRNCYSTGSVTGTLSVGGLVGINRGTVYSSFWDTETSGQASSAGGTGKTTAEMQNIHTFLAAGWDFVGEYENGPSDDWAEHPGGGYMILWHQLSPLPPIPSFSGGTGEPHDPYLISTPQDLNRIGHNSRLMDRHFRLINDIDLGGLEFFTIGSLGYPFNGVFDGNGCQISGLTVNCYGRDYIGLFNYVNAPDSEIRDVGLVDPNIDAGSGARDWFARRWADKGRCQRLLR